MAELLAKSATWGLEPRQSTGLQLTPLAGGSLYGIALFSGPDAALAQALHPLDLQWPQPGRIVAAPTCRLVWSGHNEALLCGAAPPAGLSGLAAVTRQTGAMAGFAIEGPQAAALLARLLPLDLRPAVFAPGSAARSLARHVPALLLHPAEGRFELLVPRSMAPGLWAELGAAFDRLIARGS